MRSQTVTENELMKITNINGTSDNSCRCGSWLDHWKRYSGSSLPQWCVEETCDKEPEVGAHVQKNSIYDESWYIIPLCKEHNSLKGRSLEINDVEMVSANVAKTCGGPERK